MAARKVVKQFEMKHEAVGRILVPIKFDPDGNNFFVDTGTPCHLNCSDNNIAVVEKYIRETVHKSLSVEWRPCIHVEVELLDGRKWSSQHGNENHRQLGITYRLIEVGKQIDGVEIMREKPDSRYWPPVPPTGTQSAGTLNGAERMIVTSIIPNTPANLIAMESIHDAMDALSSRIGELLAPDKIQLTLLNTKALLPMPKEAKA